MNRKKAQTIVKTIAGLLIVLTGLLYRHDVINSRANAALLISILLAGAAMTLFVRFKCRYS